MNNPIRWLIVPALLAGVAIVLHAQDYGAARTKGAVLLLKNGHAMEGEIEKIGSQMCVRRGMSETWIAADKTARLCADWDDAFAYVRSMLKADDANELVKLARWCHLHQMDERALEQARLALQLQPANSDAKQIVTLLERKKLEAPAKSIAPAPVTAPKNVETAPMTVDVTSDCSIKFTTVVQPILMNTCASCHATGQGGKFQLERVSDNTQKAATQRNLAAVMAYIDIERPAISPLLTRAITPHGSERLPAIKSRDAKAFQTLQQWIETTVARNPQLKDYATAKKPAFSTTRPVLEPVAAGVSNFASLQTSKDAPQLNTAPKSTPMVADPYGPDLFNKHYHPHR